MTKKQLNPSINASIGQKMRLTKVGFSGILLHQFNPKSEDKLRQAESDIVFIRLKID